MGNAIEHCQTCETRVMCHMERRCMAGSPCWERGYSFDTGHSCESCGGTLYIADNADGGIYDGNEYECHACGKHGSMTVYDDGEVCAHEFEADG